MPNMASQRGVVKCLHVSYHRFRVVF